jgi:hypothetical protein
VFAVRVQRIVRVLELAGAVMEELGNSQGPRSDAVASHCREFMIAIKVTCPLPSSDLGPFSPHPCRTASLSGAE